MTLRSYLKQVKTVAVWEFNRFFKISDMLKGIAYFALFGVIGGIAGVWLGRSAMDDPAPGIPPGAVAIVDYGPYRSFLATDLAPGDGQWTLADHTGTPQDQLERMLQSGELAGILDLSEIDDPHLTLPSEALSTGGWVQQLERWLIAARRAWLLEVLGIDETQAASLDQNIALRRTVVDDHDGLRTDAETESRESSLADKIFAGIAIALVLMAVLMSFGYQFVAITAEKQQRITEQVLSAIEARGWMDGKILGISSIGLVYVLFYSVMGMLTLVGLIQFGVIPLSTLALLNPWFFVVFLLLALLGVLMWNSFFAALAAMIDDPNTSQKSAWMMTPLLPALFSFYTIVNADTLPVKVLSLFPLSSFAFMPPRMALATVPWWESVLALVLLAATAWLFRKLAIRVFATSMMMYGKEPTIKEIVHWFRRA